MENLVPTLCVGMPSATLRVVTIAPLGRRAAYMHSHAERGNEQPDILATISKIAAGPGAKVVAQVPHAGGGTLGAARLA